MSLPRGMLLFMALVAIPNNTFKLVDSENTTLVTVFETESFVEDATDGINTASSESLNSTLTKPTWSFYPFTFTWYDSCQIIFGLAGTGGNFLVILVLFRRRHAGSSTDTLIAALAVADLLTSLLIFPRYYVLTSPYLWFSRLYCYLIGTDALLRVIITASVFTLTALSVQRYIAVMHPIRYRIAFNRRRTILYVIMLWVLSVVVNIYIIFYAYIDPDLYLCTFKALSPTVQISGSVAYLLTSFVIPVLIMGITQFLVIRRLHGEAENFKKESSGRTDESNPAFRLRVARNRVISLVLVVIITFLLSWTPTQLGLLIFQIIIVKGDTLLDPQIYWSIVIVAYVNSCANPVIYTARYPQFRQAVREMFSCNVSAQKQRPLFEEAVLDAADASKGESSIPTAITEA